MTELIRASRDLANAVHEGQERKGGKPYITHPIRVARIVRQYTSDENSIITAYLHDAIEDTEEVGNFEREDLSDMVTLLFGDEVLGLVMELTNDDDALAQSVKDAKNIAQSMVDKFGGDRKLAEKKVGKAKYLANKMKKMSDEALTVKLADRLDNVSDNPNLGKRLETDLILRYLESTRMLNPIQRDLFERIENKIEA